MKILILGGAGFMGSNLASHLNRSGHSITVMDNLVRAGVEYNLPTFHKESIQFVRGDIRCVEDFNKLDGGYDVVLLLAAQPSAVNYSNPTFDITNNTMGVLNTLEYIRGSGAGLIFWSTNKCYSGEVCNAIPYFEKAKRFEWLAQDPSTHYWGWSPLGFNEDLSIDGKDRSIYGVSKAMADILIQEWSDAYDIPSIINRLSCQSGPNQFGMAEQGWVTWFAIANELGLPIEIFGFEGKQVRDNLYVSDLCQLISKQIEKLSNYRGEIFNVGGGRENSLSLLEAIDTIEGLTSKKFSNIKFHQKERRADQRIYISDISKVSEEFGWVPTISPYESYRLIVEWVKEHKEILGELHL